MERRRAFSELMQRLFRTFLIGCFLAGISLSAPSLWLPVPTEAWAQSAREKVVRTAGQPTHLFASVDAPADSDGFLLQLPRDWQLEDVRLLRYGVEPTPVTTIPLSGQHWLEADDVRGPHDLVLRVRPPNSAQRRYSRWSVRPYAKSTQNGDVLRQPIGSTFEQGLILEDVPTDDASERRASRRGGVNRVLTFDEGEGTPVRLDPRSVPALERSVSFTVEFWFATLGLGEVVASTWSGDEAQSYPLEITVDASGRIRYYHGRPGQHRSMSSQRPVADGRWHHFAISYDGMERSLRLMIDGVAVDSLSGVSLPGGYRRPDLAIGGRPQPASVSQARPTPQQVLYSGQIDVFRMWNTARPPMRIRQTMREGTIQRGSSDRDDPFVVTLAFDDPADESFVAEWPTGASRVASTLQLWRSIHDLQASMEEGRVRLTWSSEAPGVAAYVVERSTDGQRFDEVQRIRPEDATPSRSSVDRIYTAADTPPAQVVFYRLREVYTDGTDDVSGTFKVGVGPPEEKEETEISANYPNPFSGKTTVEYRLHEAAQVTFTLWDVSGKRLGVVFERSLPAGQHEFSLSANDLPSGTYFLRLQTGRTSDSHQIVVLK